MLCLHGHGSNSDITSMQLAFLLAREHGIACDCLNATIECGPQTPVFYSFSDGAFFTWFNSWWAASGRLGVGREGGSLHQSLVRIMVHVDNHGPYDGVYGFSQGAFMAACLCNPTVWRGLCGRTACPFRFAILACGALADRLHQVEVEQLPAAVPARPLASPASRAATEQGGSHAHPLDLARLLHECGDFCVSSVSGVSGVMAAAPSTAARLELPVGRGVASLHIVGALDWWRKDSLKLVTTFEDSASYEHPYGHELPMRLQQDDELRARLAAFFARVDRRSQPSEEAAPAPTGPQARAEPLGQAVHLQSEII